MKICLKTIVRDGGQYQFETTLSERLPLHVTAPCHLTCEMKVDSSNNYYLLNLQVKGELEITCQRCLQSFAYPYQNESQLAVCARDEDAERLSDRYDCLVATHHQIDLTDFLTDDLHLFLPEKHLDSEHCDGEISLFIRGKQEDLDE